MESLKAASLAARPDPVFAEPSYEDWLAFRDEVDELVGEGMGRPAAVRLAYRDRYHNDPGPIDLTALVWLWMI